MLKVSLTPRTILLVFALILAGTLLISLAEVEVLLLITLLLAVVLDPIVEFLCRHRVPRVMAILLVLCGLLSPAMLLIGWLFPIAIEQTRAFAEHLSSYGKLLQSWLLVNPAIPAHPGLFDPRIQDWLSNQSGKLVGGTTYWLGSAVNGLIGGLFILFSLLYLLLDKSSLAKTSLSLFPAYARPIIAEQSALIAKRLRSFFVGRLLSMAALALVLGIGLLLVRVPHALFLASLAGILEFVPFFGAAVGLLIASLLALTISWQTFLWVLGVFAVAQFLNGHVVTPLILAKKTDIPPFVLLIALLIGSKLLGALGAFLAIPVAVAAGVVIQTLYIPQMDRKISPSEISG
jgi:predicted PurR-regulated permease PerM